MHSSLKHLNHRPWDLPQEKWQWRQSWYDLAFLHFRAEAKELREYIPNSLEIEQYDGTAWISIVPFRMFDVMRGNLPSLYPLRNFPELNLRTYVREGERSGVWFFSLDADCFPIVAGGRLLYNLPYFYSSMKHSRSKGVHDFMCCRRFTDVKFSAQFRPIGEEFYADAGSFEHWVTERYCLYSSNRRGVISSVDVHHKQWPLKQVEYEIRENDLFKTAKLNIIESESIGHFSHGVDVISYKPNI